jgi:hypothetical protein
VSRDQALKRTGKVSPEAKNYTDTSALYGISIRIKHFRDLIPVMLGNG